LALELHREDLVARGELLGQEGGGVPRDLLRVRRRDSVGPAEGLLQPVLGDVAQLVEVRAQPAPVEDLVLDRFLELSLRDDPAVAQEPGEDRQSPSDKRPYSSNARRQPAFPSPTPGLSSTPRSLPPRRLAMPEPIPVYHERLPEIEKELTERGHVGVLVLDASPL